VFLADRGKEIIAGAPEPSQGKLLYGLQKLSVHEVMRLNEVLRKVVKLTEVD